MDEGIFGNPFGVLVEGRGHHAFIPSQIPPKIEYDDRLVGELCRTERRLGELAAAEESFPLPNALGVFGGVEAVESSRIEGTTATFQDLLRWDLGGMSTQDARRLRMAEVINYRFILRERWQDVKSGGHLDNDAVMDMYHSLWHQIEDDKILADGFRLHQNWIGGGKNILDATYVPPPPRYVPPLMDDLEEFINGESEVSGLLRCAITHYQFEAIHPFHDGNGRVGRLVLCLMLASHARLTWPLDISTYIKQKQMRYYNKLLRVSTHSEWNEWFGFVLGVIRDATTGSIRRIRLLQKEVTQYKKMAKTDNGYALVDMLVETPVITIPHVRNRLGMSYPGTKNLVETFVGLGILEEMVSEKKPRMFFAPRILGAVCN